MSQAFQSAAFPAQMFKCSNFPHDVCVSSNIMRTAVRKRLSKSMRNTLTARLDFPTLVFITPDGISRDVNRAVEVCGRVLQTPSTLVQIRDTMGNEEDISTLVGTLLKSGLSPTRLIVNGLDFEKVLSLHENLGFHMKERDAMKGLGLFNRKSTGIVGCAVHSVSTAKQALMNHRLDYLQVGTMFKTLTHPGKSPEGPQLLEQIASLDCYSAETRLIAVGGVNFDNAESLMKHGAHGVAAIRTISAAGDPELAANKMMGALKRGIE